MTKAGLSDATVVACVKARRTRLDSILSAEDLIQLRRAEVSETVIEYLASVTAIDVGQTGESRQVEATYDSSEGRAYPVEPVYGGAYTYPYGYGYYPPYFSTSAVFIGRPFFHQPFFRHHFFFPHRFLHRPFFGRRFHHGFVSPRGSVPIGSFGSRMVFPAMQRRTRGRFVGLGSQMRRGPR